MREHDYDADEPLVVIERHSGSVSSFLFGLAIGAGAALLLAPRSGDETRRGIQRGARRARVAAQDAAEGLTDSVLDRYQYARRAVEDRLEAARHTIQVTKQQATHAIRAGREAAQQAREELERRIAETKAAYEAGTEVARGERPAPEDEPADEAPAPTARGK